MKKRERLTMEQVEEEIKRLNNSPYVRLARQEQREKYRKEQYMYQLRWLEKRGMQLQAEGHDPDFADEDLIDPEYEE